MKVEFTKQVQASTIEPSFAFHLSPSPTTPYSTAASILQNLGAPNPGFSAFGIRFSEQTTHASTYYSTTFLRTEEFPRTI
jgi:hypothetical protein